MTQHPELSADERLRYEWQLWVNGFGEEGQRRLKGTTVFISRIGGVGGTVALQLAAAGIGRLVLAHAGELRLNDLNRQLLMSTTGLGKPRIECAVQRLHDLNPNVEVEAIGENINADNARRLTQTAQIIVSAAPLFEERLQMNAAAVSRTVPLVDCAMYELEGRLTTIVPGQTPCLSCLYPEVPPNWKREFPVFSCRLLHRGFTRRDGGHQTSSRAGPTAHRSNAELRPHRHELSNHGNSPQHELPCLWALEMKRVDQSSAIVSLTFHFDR